jgi:uncharacterized protein YbcV (DUF1398 family)
MRLRPPVGGFPYLAESLRQAGISTVHCDVAQMSTIYRTTNGAVIDQQAPLVRGLKSIGAFDEDAVIAAIRQDQRGESTYGEFMADIWTAGVVSYDVDLEARTCTYYGIDTSTDVYIEEYPHVELDADPSDLVP